MLELKGKKSQWRKPNESMILWLKEVKTPGQNKWLENLYKLLCQTKKNWIANSPSHGHIHLSSKICIYLIYLTYFKGGFIRNDY